EERRDAGGAQQEPVDLGRAQVGAARQVDRGRRARLAAEHGRAPAPHGRAERGVEVGGAGRGRAAALVEQQLETAAGQVVAAHPVAGVVDERGEEGVTHRVGQIYGEHAGDSRRFPHAPADVLPTHRLSLSTFWMIFAPTPSSAVRIDSGWNCTAKRRRSGSSMAMTLPSGVTAVAVKPTTPGRLACSEW